MNAKTSFFNKKIFTRQVIGALPFVLPLTGLMIIIGLTSIKNSLRFLEYNYQAAALKSLMVQYDLMNLFNSGIMKAFLAVYSFCCGIYVFRYLYQKKLSLTIHALPLTRTCLYLTNVIAGFAVLVMPILLTSVILGIYILLQGHGISYLPLWVLVTIGFCLIFYALSVLTAVLTGHMLAAPIIYFIFNFGFIISEILLRAFVSTFYFGVPEMEELPDSRFLILTPFVKLWQRLWLTMPGSVNDGIHYAGSGIQLLAVYGIAALLLVIIGLLLYRKRKLELYGDPIVFKKLQPVFLYIGTVLGSTIAAYILFSIFYLETQIMPDNKGTLLLIALFILSSIVVYYLITMLLHKSFRVIRAHYKGIVIYCCAALAAFLLIRLDVLGIESKIPETADIASVNLFFDITDVVAADEKDLEKILDIHQEFIQGKEELIKISHNSPDLSEAHFNPLTLTYTLKNGKTLTRSYYLPYDDNNTPMGDVSRSINEKCRELLNDQELMLDNLQKTKEHIDFIQIGTIQEDEEDEKDEERWHAYQDYYLHDKDYETLIAAMQEDIRTGALHYQNSYETDAPCYLSFFCSFGGYHNLNLHYRVSSDCTHTLQVLEKLQEEYASESDTWTAADEFE